MDSVNIENQFEKNKINQLRSEILQQCILYQDQINQMQDLKNLLQSELRIEHELFQDYVRAVNNSWSWRITSPLRFIDRVIKLLNHHLRREIEDSLKGIRTIVKRPLKISQEKTQGQLQEQIQEQIMDGIALEDAMTFFRNNEDSTISINHEIDIIIPIENNISSLITLFDNLFRNTDLPYRLILVDDGSQDHAVQEFLQNIVRQRSGTVLIHNQQKKGFVQSVNAAAKHAKNHFILLNTDVEVPKGWLQRLMRPIIEGSNIASTTPFTNAGAICSFTHFNIGDNLFGNLTVDEIDDFFKRVDPDSISIELPCGVGFCMGINFNAWKQIGSLNKIFGRYYGGEKDWCMRAQTAGYRNVLVPNLFVFHQHAGDSGREFKERYEVENLDILLKLHPSYQQKIEDFIKRDPVKPLRQFLTLLLITNGAQSGTTLIIDHSYGGGANTYRQEVIRERLANGEVILLLTYDMDNRIFNLKCLYKEYNLNFTSLNFRNVYLLLLLELISCKEIFYNSLVTFPQQLNILRNIYCYKKNSGVSLTITIHDYYPICPSYILHHSTGMYCNLPVLEICRTCLPTNQYAYHATDRDIDKWRKTWEDILKIADTILCFSESSRALLTKIYSLRPEQITVKPHKLLTHFTRKPNIDLSGSMNIGVFGEIGLHHKGSKIVIEMAKILENKAPEAKITVIGTLNDTARYKNLMVTGPYKPLDLPDLIEKYRVNISFFPSIWPETFSYVCSELMELGMPVCCFDLGAQGERVSKFRFGHIISRISPETAVEEIIHFFSYLQDNYSKF